MEESSMTQPEVITAVWNRLQCLSCEHAFRLWKDGTSKRSYRRGVTVPEVIQENVDILARADEAEMKARALWYVTFHPDVFNTCASRGWKVTA
jgi:hypothetical protein